MPQQSLFGGQEEDLIRKQAQNLLNDYGHPWDSLAEGVQNSVDAINRRYIFLLAESIDIELDELKQHIEDAAEIVVERDKDEYQENYENWSSEEYQDNARERWYDALSNEIGIESGVLEEVDKEVRESYTGEIKIERIDSTRTIKIRDNGIGMSFDELEYAVLKGGSHKDEDSSTSEIGELGNGLTYQICSCDDFVIETSDGDDVYRDSVEGMYTWIQNPDGQSVGAQPKSDPTQVSDQSDGRFTEVDMTGIRSVSSDFPDIFSDEMTTDRFVHLLRTKTALGHLYEHLGYPVFDTLRSDEMEIEFIDTTDMGSETVELDFQYNGPKEISEDDNPTATNLLSRDEAKDRVESNQNIGGSALHHRGIYESASDITLYYHAFVSSRDWYRKASHSLGLCDNPGGSIDEMDDYDVHPSLELGVKGMPTAVTISSPPGDSIGYWANLHIVIMDNRLEFDEGRKSVVGRRNTLYRNCADEALYDEITTGLIQEAVKDPTVALNVTQMGEERQTFINQNTEDRTDLSYSGIPDSVQFAHEPEEEQDVVALFHELISGGLLSPYKCLAASSYSTYDAIFEYEIGLDYIGRQYQIQESDDPLIENVVLEYKVEGEDILDDISRHQKFYYMMDLLVCWEIDEQACQDVGATLIDKTADSTKYWGTTHELVLEPMHFDHLGSGRNLDVIELRSLLEMVSNGNYPLSHP